MTPVQLWTCELTHRPLLIKDLSQAWTKPSTVTDRHPHGLRFMRFTAMRTGRKCLKTNKKAFLVTLNCGSGPIPDLYKISATTYSGVQVAQEEVQDETLALAEGSGHGYNDNGPIFHVIFQQNLRQGCVIELKCVITTRLDYLDRDCTHFWGPLIAVHGYKMPIKGVWDARTTLKFSFFSRTMKKFLSWHSVIFFVEIYKLV